jgi:hypothetical protein
MRGRRVRSNGLTAAAYTPVADVDPRLADALLEELRERGIAAYAEPVATTSMSGLNGPEFVTGALERLYVASSGADDVRRLIRQHDAELVNAANDDLSWAQIVADFDQPVSAEKRVWPAEEELPEPSHVALDADSTPDTAVDDERGSGAGRLDDPLRLPDRDDHFIPPPPPPLPSLDPVTQVAWVGLVGGPLLLLVAVIFGLSLPAFVSGLAVIGFVGGFVTLVARMQRDDPDDPASGAVV